MEKDVKVICYVRSSTDKQEVESQRKEVFEMAIKDGYTKDQILSVGGEGISAVKGGDDYKALFAQMYRHMEDYNVKCVYVWSVNRLIRNDDVEFFKLRSHLVKNKINLKVKTPSLELLDADGNCNLGVSIAFAIFAEMAKVDIEEMREKFKRGKARNAANGRYNGGKVRYGYRLAETTYTGDNGKIYKSKVFAIDDEAADVIRRRIYGDYVNTVISARKIADNLYKDGIINHRSTKTREMFVLEVLRSKVYTGERVAILDANGHPTYKTDADGNKVENTIQYPAIITTDVWEAAQAKMAQYRKQAKEPVENKKTVCYGLGLMRVKSGEAKQGYYTMQVKRCDAQMFEPVSKFTINADIADSLLLQTTDQYITEFAAKDAGAITKDLVQLQIEKTARAQEANAKANSIQERLDSMEKKVLRGILRPEIAEEMETELLNEKKAELAIVERLMAEIEELSDKATAIIDEQPQSLYRLCDVSRREKIMKYIDYCEVERVRNSVYTIAVHYKLNSNVDTYRIQSKKGVFERLEGETWQPFNLNRLNRYTARKRS